jgi:surfactin synthase thioesterase subunit
MQHRLLFLPGAGADPAFWRPLGDRLPATWEKVYFGWPGLGAQPPSPDVNGLEDWVSSVANLWKTSNNKKVPLQAEFIMILELPLLR